MIKKRTKQAFYKINFDFFLINQSNQTPTEKHQGKFLRAKISIFIQRKGHMSDLLRKELVKEEIDLKHNMKRINPIKK